MPRVIQQVDINDVPLVIQEHRGHPGWCSHCQKVYEAPLPVGIERGGLVGPRLTTVIAYLKGVCHASFSTVRKFVRDVSQADHLAWATGEYHCQGEPGVGASPIRNCWRACRTKGGSTSTRPVTSKIVYGNGPGAFGPACTRCSRSTRRAGADVLIEVLGAGV